MKLIHTVVFGLTMSVLSIFAGCGGGGSGSGGDANNSTTNEPTTSDNSQNQPSTGATSSGTLSIEADSNKLSIDRRSSAENAIAALSNGDVVIWGRNLHEGAVYQPIAGSTAQKVDGISNIISVYNVFNQAFALDRSGAVYGWGQDTYGFLRQAPISGGQSGYTDRPYEITSLGKLRKLAVCAEVSFASYQYPSLWGLRSNGEVYFYPGKISNTSITSSKVDTLPSITGLWPYVENSNCIAYARASNGDVYKLVGNHRTSANGGYVYTASAVRDPNLPRIKDMACDENGCTAISDSGEVFAWGKYIGDGTYAGSIIPVKVNVPSNPTKVRRYSNNSFIFYSDGSIYQWGPAHNSLWGLGADTVATEYLPKKMAFSGYRDVVVDDGAGSYTVLLVEAGGAIAGFGRNRTGLLGNGNTNEVKWPTLAHVLAVNLN